MLLQLGSNEQQRSELKEMCWKEAQKILSDHWFAVQVLAKKLLKRETLSGKEAHCIIWQAVGYPDHDWRLQTLEIKKHT